VNWLELLRGRQGKVKRAAFTYLARQPHLPIQFFHNLPHNRQSQSMPDGPDLIQVRERSE
jgi:hypothetical protein